MNTWEQTRYIAFVVAACQTEEIKKPQDLRKFSWDTENVESQPMTKEEILLAEQEMLEWLSRQ